MGPEALAGCPVNMRMVSWAGSPLSVVVWKHNGPVVRCCALQRSGCASAVCVDNLPTAGPAGCQYSQCLVLARKPECSENRPAGVALWTAYATMASSPVGQLSAAGCSCKAARSCLCKSGFEQPWFRVWLCHDIWLLSYRPARAFVITVAAYCHCSRSYAAELYRRSPQFIAQIRLDADLLKVPACGVHVV